MELSPAAKVALGEENSISDIRRYFEQDRPMEANEFVVFWKSLTDEEKDEFKKADLSS